MKIIRTASGKQTIKISKAEWESIGKKAGWDSGVPERDGQAEEYEITEFKDTLKNISENLAVVNSLISKVPSNDIGWYMNYYGLNGDILKKASDRLQELANDFKSGSFGSPGTNDIPGFEGTLDNLDNLSIK